MNEFVTLATFDFPTEAEVHKSLLERHGIRAFLADGNLVAMDWLVSNAVGGVKLQVAAADADRAEKILEQYRAENTAASAAPADGEITFACQECGRSITFAGDRCGHVETCPHCNEYVDVPLKSDPTLLPEAKATREPDPPRPLDSSSRTSNQLWIEVFAVLCLAYFPYLFSAISSFGGLSTASHSPFVHRELYFIICAIQVSVPLLLIMALSKDPWSLFGIVRPIWIIDALLVCVVWISDRVAREFVVSLLPTSILGRAASLTVAHRLAPERISLYILVLAGCIVGGFSEELVMRGYLIPRLERLLRSTWLPVVVTSLAFGSCHLYQGVTAAVGTAVTGLIYAVAFCLCRRLWPLCMAHALHNFLLYLR